MTGRMVTAMAALAMTLGGCGADGGATAPGEGAGDCGAGSLQHLVGQPASVATALDHPAPVRIIRPGQMVTMDYRPERLNLEVDAASRIVRVACG